VVEACGLPVGSVNRLVRLRAGEERRNTYESMNLRNAQQPLCQISSYHFINPTISPRTKQGKEETSRTFGSDSRDSGVRVVDRTYCVVGELDHGYCVCFGFDFA
jgi:hypothetical protein